MVVQSRTRLPEMAESHTRVDILPRSLPRLYIWHVRGRHAGTFTTPPIHY
jgi:hypothetical protein